MTNEPDNLVLTLLRGIRGDLADTKAEFKADTHALRADVHALRAELKADMNSLRADVASDLHTTRKELGDQIVGLRRAVIEYHSAVIGHGVIISELEARVRRMEQHLNLPSMDAH